MTDHTIFGRLVEKEGIRDAIHVAAISVVAGGTLKPGDKVVRSGNTYRKIKVGEQPMGIVDPFLFTNISSGDIFWLFLRPGTITGLRHVWEHPDFPADEIEWKEFDVDKQLVEELASIIGFTYDRVMRDYDAHIRYDHYEYDNSESYKYADSKHWEALARHYKKLNPDAVIDDKYGAPVPYTCSC